MDGVCVRGVRSGAVLLLGLLLSTWGLSQAYGQEEGGAVREGEERRVERGGERAEREAQLPLPQRREAAQAGREGGAQRFTSDEAARLLQQAEQMDREGKAEAAAELKKKAERVEAEFRASRERAGEKERAKAAEAGREREGQAVRESDLRGEITALRQDVKKLQEQVTELTALLRKLVEQR